MLGGLLGGARPARVDHHDLAAALADRADATAHVRRRQQAAVRDQRVRAPDHQVVGAVDIRDRDRVPVPEHVPGREVLRHLVHRRSRVDVLRAERPQEDPQVDHRRQVVRVRVAGVDGDGVAPVRFKDRRRGRASISANASSQVASRSSPSRRTSGDRSRSGSSRSSFSPNAFGQMNPWLRTSSSSPRIETISPSATSTRSPQVASQKGQVRKWVSPAAATSGHCTRRGLRDATSR